MVRSRDGLRTWNFEPCLGKANSIPYRAFLGIRDACDSFTLTISLYKNSVKPSGFVNLKVVTTNISDRDLGVYRVAGSAESIFEISVTTADGKVADETLYGRRLHGKEPHGTWRPHENLMVGTLKPGDTMDEFIYLSDVYDFSQPGEYTIEVSQAYSSGQADDKTTARPRVHSNKVVLTVTK